jgi:FkbM family methyltransferase
MVASLRSSRRGRGFSQTGEDLLIAKFFPEPGSGFYLDVGSGQPVIGSNTYSFYRQGWRGILIDPIPRNVRLTKLLRFKDRAIESLVGEIQESRNFFELEPYEYSTTVASTAEKLIATGEVKLVRILEYKTMPLSDLDLSFSPIDRSFLTVDVEGFDLQVLRSINWDEFRPRVVCIEAWEHNIEANLEIHELLTFNGYFEREKTVLSKIYVHGDYLHLRGKQ